MNTNRRLLAVLIALMAALPLTAPMAPALAQQAAAAKGAPRIDGFDVKAAPRLSSGNELAFTLYGTPGGIAGVQVGGATGALILVEVEAGVYEGTYTIARRDRITVSSTATANLRLGNRIASSVLDDALLSGAAPRWPGDMTAGNTIPKIDRFDVDPPDRLVPGAELFFSLTGSPGGGASVRIAGVRGKLNLEEVRTGVYEGAYTVKNRDRLQSNSVVTGNLRLGKQERSSVLKQSLVETASSGQSRRSARRAAAPAPVCANCGVIEAINLIEVKGEGSYLGMIAGGVAGALLGSQVGKGSGTTVAQVVGAAGGAYAGNEVEKRMKASKHYEVTVRLENGGSQMVSYPTDPGMKIGARVKVENGALVAVGTTDRRRHGRALCAAAHRALRSATAQSAALRKPPGSDAAIGMFSQQTGSDAMSKKTVPRMAFRKASPVPSTPCWS
ncbi:MAG: glycine zipper 2TM domain-containing protein [Betaproteobacteria bacterium]|nr:glycine zipper 2TM domain-containing protein [Betaproteobacteria bacterium]